MAGQQHVNNPQGDRLVYELQDGRSPCVVFLSGYRSNMTGTKAQYLADWCSREGLAMLRLDYSGHGASGGSFEDGSISKWTRDTLVVIDAATTAPLLLVGSSMGGWIMLNVALALGQRVRALIGIAAAPDFTRRLLRHELTGDQCAALERDGRIVMDSEYDSEGYPLTRTFVDDGEKNLLLDRPIQIDCPVRLLHGMQDQAVPWETTIRLSQALAGNNVQVRLIKDGDHRLSEPGQLAILGDTISDTLGLLAVG